MQGRKFIVILMVLVSLAQLGFGQNRGETAFAADKTEPGRQVSLYPNPSTDYLNVKFDLPCAKKIKLSLQNIIGNVLEVETDVLDEHEIQLKVRDLPTGFYLLTIKDPETSLKSTYKFLKR
jgi:Secretion system C-terminal sorting domain